jgi:hypothetical protein
LQKGTAIELLEDTATELQTNTAIELQKDNAPCHELPIADESIILFMAKTAINPGTATTKEGVCRGLRLARLPEAASLADGLALDYLTEWVCDPHWLFAPLAGATCTAEIRAHFARCAAVGEETLVDANHYVKVHDSMGCTPWECRESNALAIKNMTDGRRALQNQCNLAEAAALSKLPIQSKAPALASKTRLKAVSKRR